MSPDRPPRILLVCTGNTCRSPMAAGLMRRAAERRAIDLEVASAGTAAAPDAPAAPEAVAVLLDKGVDLSSHRSRRLEAQDVEAADLVLTMTAAQRDRVLELAPGARDRVHTLSEYATGDASDIPDPLGAGLERYRETAQTLERLVDAALDRYLQERGRPS